MRYLPSSLPGVGKIHKTPDLDMYAAMICWSMHEQTVGRYGQWRYLEEDTAVIRYWQLTMADLDEQRARCKTKCL